MTFRARSACGARSFAAIVALAAAVGCGRADYTAVGDVVAIDPAATEVTIRHDAIPGLMPAMTMAFPVGAADVLARTSVGTRVRFDLVRRGDRLVVTRLKTLGGPAAARPGMHDHAPHHGGVVAMVGMLHLEAVASAGGRVRVYVTDVWRRPLPVAGITGTLTVTLPEGRRTVPFAPAGDALEADASPLPGLQVLANVALIRDGAPLDMHFVLPVGPGATGAAEVPLDGCQPVPVDPAGRRTPRCVLSFARPVTALAPVPDGEHVLVAVVNGGVGLWALPAPRFVLGFAAAPAIAVPADATPHAEAATAIAPSPDGRETLVAIENRLLVHETSTGRVLRELPPLAGVVRGIAWSPDGAEVLVTAFYDATAHLVAARDGRELRRIPVDREGAAVAFSPDGRFAAVGSELGPIALVDRRDPAEVRVLRDGGRAVDALAFVADRLIAAGSDGILRVWDVGAGTVVLRAATDAPLTRMAVAPSGTLVACGGLDHAIRLLDLGTGGARETLAFHGAAVSGLAWVGSSLVSADEAGRVALWDVADRLTPARP